MMASAILERLLTNIKELDHKDLENGVHVQLAHAIEAQIPDNFIAEGERAFTKKTLMEAYSDALDTIKLLEFRLEGVREWTADAWVSSRDARRKSEHSQHSLKLAQDFINGNRDKLFHDPDGAHDHDA